MTSQQLTLGHLVTALSGLGSYLAAAPDPAMRGAQSRMLTLIPAIVVADR